MPAGTTANGLAGQGVVVDQESTVIRFAQDGSNIRTLSVTEHVLSDAGVRSAGVVSMPFASQTDTLTFDSVRVIKPSGQVIETPTGDAQDVPLPVTQQAPMYSDLRTRQLPVRSLSAGDTLEYRLTLKDSNAAAPGAVKYATDFTDGLPVKQETLEIHVPRGMDLLVKSKKVQPTVTDADGERIYRWTHEMVSEYPKKNEPDKTAPVSLVQESYEPDVAITSFHTWAEMGAWYRTLIQGRATPDDAVRAKADELTRGLATDEARMNAIYNYVSTQYRYIAVSLGIGRLQPHTAAEIFQNQYGDCKDKSTLLVAMLAAGHIQAEPVLISSETQVNEALPIPQQFNHMITLVKLKDRDVWLDSTPEVAPVGFLLAGLRDKLALEIPPTGEARLIRTEAKPPFPMFLQTSITGQLGPDGALTAHFDMAMRGDTEVIYRSLYNSVPRANWQQLQQQVSYRLGFGGDVTNVDASLPTKTTEPFHISWDYARKDYGDWPNRRIPMLTPWLVTTIPENASPPKRAILLDPDTAVTAHTVLTLPTGYSLVPPANVTRSTSFGEYKATFALKDNVLTADSTIRETVSELPTSQFDAYRDFMKATSDDNGQMLQLVGAGIETKASRNVRPDNPQATELIQQAYAEYHAGNRDAASALLDRVKALNDQQSSLWAMYGALEWTANADQAIADYRKEIELHPETLFAYSDLSRLLMTQRKWDDAEQALQSWGKADPADPASFAALGSLQIEQKQSKEAVTTLQKAISLSSKPDALKISLGQAQLQSGDTKAGEATLHALMTSSGDPTMLNGAAYELADAGLDLPECEAASRKAIAQLEQKTAAVTLAGAKNEDFANVTMLVANWDSLGWILFKENHAAAADPYIRSAWLMLPENSETGQHMGMVEEAEGKKADALRTYYMTLKAAGHPGLLEDQMDRKTAMEVRVAALTREGVHASPSPHTEQGGDELAASRTYSIPSPLHGQYASADFLFLLGDNRADDVSFLKGDDALKMVLPTLKGLSYRSPLPPQSAAKILRRGIVACTTGSKTCLLVLVPPVGARMEN